MISIFLQEPQLLHEPKALTDDLEQTSDTVDLTDPHWEHSDKDKAQNTPDSAAIGDNVTLKCTCKGVPEGGRVSFDIYDMANDPPLRIDTVKGKNEQGTAKATWEITDPNDRKDELKLEFEAVAKSKSSVRAEIDLINSNPCETKCIKGGATIHIHSHESDLLENVEAVLRTENEELYSGVLSDGILEIEDIERMSMIIECTYNGKSITRPVDWNAGGAPYPVQAVELHFEEKEGQ